MNNKFLLVIAFCFTLANNACAANKTHVTDTLGSGNSRMDISYSVGSGNLPGNYVFGGGTNQFSIDYKVTASRLSISYLLGVTDRLDIGIFLPISENTKLTQDYVVGANKYNDTARYQGQGDVTIGASYLFLDKKRDQVNWQLTATITPSTAPSDDGTTESTTNGNITTPGKTGQSGNGYMTTTLASILSVPAGAGTDVFLKVEFTNHGVKNSSGVSSKTGSITSFTFGIENMVGERVTFTPYLTSNMYTGGYDGTTTLAARSGYDFGLYVTNDISKNVSVKVGAEYNMLGNYNYAYQNGDKWNFSGNGYTLYLSTLLFF